MRKVLLDTNGYTRFLQGDEDVLDEMSDADTVLMSIVVLGELHAGFAGGRHKKRNTSQLNQFLAKPTVEMVDATHHTAEIFGHIKNLLKQNATPIPINDVWIAAHVVQTGAKLVTFDRHFLKVPGLRVWDIPESD